MTFYIKNSMRILRRKIYILIIRTRLTIKKIFHKKINVGFIFVYHNAFTTQGIFRLMEKHSTFEPHIIIAPDIARGKENMVNQIQNAVKDLTATFPNILAGYNPLTDEFVDHIQKMDVIVTMQPYDDMTHKYFKIKSIYKRWKPLIFFNYGYSATTYTEVVAGLSSLRYPLAIFTENVHTQNIFKKFRNHPYDSTVLLNSHPKMDLLADKADIENRAKPTIIIAPHHSLPSENARLQLSNFLLYADFFLKLPSIYPNIKFIFRPHPILRPTLCQERHWGKEKTEQYFYTLSSYSNVYYSTELDYLNLFKNSDAIIHDCCSFIVEYLFAGKPACYMLQHTEEEKSQFSELGKACLEHYYKAYSQNDILQFIDQVVADIDPMKKERDNFFEKNLKGDFPHASALALSKIYKLLFWK